MPKTTPSKEKMRLARKFALELQKHMGERLKAIFVCGSVAANMAKPESDIDVLIICRDNEIAKSALETMWADPTYKFHKILQSLSIIETGYFEDIRFKNSPGGKRFSDGVIPVFGKKYATQHRNCWNYPNRETIKKRYIGQEIRLGFKRRKTSHVPNPHLRRK